MSDPFTDAAGRARKAADDATKRAADPNTPDKVQARIAARATAREQAAKPEPRHPWPKKFYEPGA